MEHLRSALAMSGEIPSHVRNSLSRIDWQEVRRFLIYFTQTLSYQHPWFELPNDDESNSGGQAKIPKPKKKKTEAPSSSDKDEEDDDRRPSKKRERRRRQKKILISTIKELLRGKVLRRKGYDNDNDDDDDKMKGHVSFDDIKAHLHSKKKHVSGDESTDYAATPEENLSPKDGQKRASVVDDINSWYRSPVKDNRASDTSPGKKQQFIHNARPRALFPEIKEKDAIVHHDPDSLKGKVSSKRGKPSSVSSDSGLGEGSQGFDTTSTSTTYGVHMSTSDPHNPDPSQGAHTDDLDSGEDTTNEVFTRDAEDKPAQPTPQDFSQLSEKPRLNFRSRRRMVFSEEGESRPNVSGSSEGSSSASPASSCSASSFVKSFRPLYSRQDSDSTSSVQSDDSLLAKPLSPVPAADGDEHTSTFPEGSTKRLWFSEPSEDCDLVLVAEGKRFFVHTAVVAWQCAALRQHLEQTWSQEVVLQDQRAADVLCLLHLLYPNHGERITEDNVAALVELAHYLSCERVLRMCTSYLISLASFHHLCPHRHLPPCPPSQCRSGEYMKKAARNKPACSCADTMVDRVLDVLSLASRYDLEDVYQAYKDFAASSIKASEFLSTPRFKHMSAAMRHDILMSRLTRLETVQDKLVSLQESDLVSCRHLHHHHSHRQRQRQRHQAFCLTYSGPLCLKCSARRFLQQAQSLG